MPPEQIPFRFFSSKTLIFFISIVIIAGIYLALWQRQTSHQQLTFSSKTQFVPQGAQSREVDQSLAAFGFPKPLPFFDKDNVVQSFIYTDNSSKNATSSPSGQPASGDILLLSYRVYEKDNTAVRDAFLKYFKNIGWRAVPAKSSEYLAVLPDPSHRGLIITFLNPPASSTNQRVVSVIIRTINPLTRNPLVR